MKRIMTFIMRLFYKLFNRPKLDVMSTHTTYSETLNLEALNSSLDLLKSLPDPFIRGTKMKVSELGGIGIRKSEIGLLNGVYVPPDIYVHSIPDEHMAAGTVMLIGKKIYTPYCFRDYQ